MSCHVIDWEGDTFRQTDDANAELFLLLCVQGIATMRVRVTEWLANHREVGWSIVRGQPPKRVFYMCKWPKLDRLN